MKTQLTPTALKNYLAVPTTVQKAFDKQANFLVHNLSHPSLHAKKYNEVEDLHHHRHRSSPEIG